MSSSRLLFVVAVLCVSFAAGVSCGQVNTNSGCELACGPGLVCDPASGRCVVDSSTGGGSGGGSGGGGGGQGGGVAAGDLPCDVASLLADSCDSCHGAQLAGGASMHLVTRADLAAPSYVDASKNYGQRSVIRMRQAMGAMPPAPQAPVAESRIAAFEAWVNAGLPAGSCSGTGGGGGSGGGTGGGTGGGAGGGGSSPYDGGVAGLPCDVASFVAQKCASCHRSPPVGGATFPLLSRGDFTAMSAMYPGQSIGQRSSARLHDAMRPMPPAGEPQPTAVELSSFDAWVTGGMPQGSCGAVDAGTPDAGPAPTTCTSGVYWTRGDTGSGDMNPGKACKQCHSTRALGKAYPFSGTVFPSLHEKDLCDARPPTGTVIEIVDKNGSVALTMTPSAVSGNFHSSLFALVSMPYTARIRANGRTATMMTPQMNGDCNSCHTEQGANGARGRLVWP